MLTQARWLGALVATAAFAQTASDAPGVTVVLSGAVVLHRTAVPYPGALRQAGVQGTVVADVTLDAKGNVMDARILAGPAELRRTVLESVLQWHFAQDSANSSRQVSIQFELPLEPVRKAGDFTPSLVVLPPAPAGPLGKRIQSIRIEGLPTEAQSQLIARLPVHEGDVLTELLAVETAQAVKQFDEHLAVGFLGGPDNGSRIEIVLQSSSRGLVSPLPTAGVVQVGSRALETKLRSAPPPVYPALARQARIQGVVKLTAIVGKDGRVQNINVVSGHPLLIPAAVEAVKQWVYEPTVVNGAPVEVESGIDVPFNLLN